MATTEDPLSGAAKGLTQEEVRQHRVSLAGVFDQLVVANLGLTQAVNRLVRVSYVVLGALALTALVAFVTVVVVACRK